MPEELRKITFTVDEVFEALTAFCIRSGISTPKSSIDEIKLKGAELAFIVFYYNRLNQEPKLVSFSRDQVAAALIAYCRHNNIPIPKAAKKVLKIDRDNVVYLFRFTRLVCRSNISDYMKVNSLSKAVQDGSEPAG